jgi:Histidine kinase-, DNA gyrase B-, and HSP90-like ATPase
VAPLRSNQQLTNLLNNAAKFTPAGGNIVLRTELRPDRIALRVQDDGIGMPPELQLRVFDLFAQAERASDRSRGGLGIGLALVRTLAGLHGGKVSCSSQGVGRGSVFTGTLPRVANPGVAAAPQQHGKSTAPAKMALRILVADDDVDAAQMLALPLQASGHAVLVEYGSKRALEVARNKSPDACVLDIGLPRQAVPTHGTRV